MGRWPTAWAGTTRGDHASHLVDRDACRPCRRPTGGPDLLRAVQATLAACHRELRADRGDATVCRLHRGRPARRRGPLRLPVGRRQPALPPARRPARAADPRPQPGAGADRPGSSSPEAARTHPWRNRITRAVGVDERLELDALQDRILPGDLFLLCSDGLTGELGGGRDRGLLAAPTPETAADRLLELTLAGRRATTSPSSWSSPATTRTAPSRRRRAQAEPMQPIDAHHSIAYELLAR